jgi:hypothetical protein
MGKTPDLPRRKNYLYWDPGLELGKPPGRKAQTKLNRPTYREKFSPGIGPQKAGNIRRGHQKISISRREPRKTI